MALLILGILPSSLAFTATLEPLQNRVDRNESALLDLAITNTGKVPDSYNIGMVDGLWEVSSQPVYAYQSEYGVDVAPGETVHTTLYLRPILQLPYGTYSIPFEIGAKQEKTLQSRSAIVSLRSADEVALVRAYQPTVQVDVQLPNRGLLDPREEAIIAIKMDNQNPLNLSALRIVVNSQLINYNLSTRLAPLEQRTEQFRVSFDALEAPRKDQLTVVLFRDDEVLKTVRQQYEIIAYSSLSREQQEESSLLGVVHHKTLTLRNDGNIARTETVALPASWFNRLFSGASSGHIVKDNQYVWSLELSPGQQVQLQVTTNYGLLVLMLVLAGAVIVLYYIYRSPLIAIKEASVDVHDERDVSEMKILLFIKNRSGRQLPNVRVLDKVPHIAELTDEVIVGTLRPVKMSRSSDATIVEWVVPTVEPYEERIISYKIRSKLSIIGMFNLPPAMLKFKHRGDKERVVLSNALKSTECASED
ncbi:hypothetical protein COY28_04560 [Candidatus Woesearchaeota archaeon CG_4_10_14_0_2_um_filter_57_5]|nr:MAG: hypothetical protein AUJ68_00260 [Candidatus Woesearchaeota archaeon CG1_02_57_44]PIZ52367.1 MAG: hypothetical protein COY28_04560 [Candidatus Woesearchaeota archaeon CG_4_10_14_0_2_um_filter_57_5]